MSRKNDYIDKIDKYIGDKIYLLRLAQGLSRKQLSSIIGVSGAQLKKYESGSNRISAGRLMLVANSLDQDISYFYEDLHVENKNIITQHQRMCLEVARNFMKIENPEYQTAVNILVKSLCKVA